MKASKVSYPSTATIIILLVLQYIFTANAPGSDNLITYPRNSYFVCGVCVWQDLLPV